MRIRYLDIQAQYLTIRDEIDTAVSEVINRSDFVAGPAVATFERNFASFCGSDHCVGINNGTNALMIALKALGVGAGDEVITAANTFIATLEAIVHTGAKPVLVDVDPVSHNMNPELIEAAITLNTKVILPVHLYGRIAEMREIAEIADRHKLPIVEDAAQAHGAKVNEKRAGSIGRIAAFSFYPGKNLGAFGDAGAITTSDPDLAHTVLKLRDHGSDRRNRHDIVGYNARLNGIQATVLDVKLKHLDAWNKRRVEVVKEYHELLMHLPVQLTPLIEDQSHTYHVFALETEKRDKLQEFLADKSVSTLIHYPTPAYLQPAFTYLGYGEGSFPVTEKLSGQLLSLPIYPEMTRDHTEFVAARIGEFFGLN